MPDGVAHYRSKKADWEFTDSFEEKHAYEAGKAGCEALLAKLREHHDPKAGEPPYPMSSAVRRFRGRDA